MIPAVPSSPPPRLAVCLLNLFVSNENAESILGDLFEEFSALASGAGVVSARRWFWRQSLRTLASQFSVNFRFAPASLFGSVLAGFLLLRFGGGLSEKVIFAVLHRFPIYPNHWNAYVFWISDGLLIGRVFESIFVGCLVALVSKRRELPATTALGLAQFLYTGVLYFAALLWNRFDSRSIFEQSLSLLINAVAILVGGIIVKEIRVARSHHSATA